MTSERPQRLASWLNAKLVPPRCGGGSAVCARFGATNDGDPDGPGVRTPPLSRQDDQGPARSPTGTGERRRRVLRAQPEPLSEVAGPLGMVRAACPCTRVPSLELSALGGGRDVVDSSALVFLVCRAVEDRRKEEEEEEEEKVKEEARMKRIERSVPRTRRPGDVGLHRGKKEEEEEEVAEGSLLSFFLSREEGARPHRGGLFYVARRWCYVPGNYAERRSLHSLSSSCSVGFVLFVYGMADISFTSPSSLAVPCLVPGFCTGCRNSESFGEDLRKMSPYSTLLEAGTQHREACTVHASTATASCCLHLKSGQ